MGLNFNPYSCIIKYKFSKNFLIILVLLFFIILIAINLNFFPSIFLDLIFKFIPDKLSNLLYFNFSNIDLYPRLDIWNVAIKSIIKNPLFGWGAASFPLLYTIFRNESINDLHQHITIIPGTIYKLWIDSFISNLL